MTTSPTTDQPDYVMVPREPTMEMLNAAIDTDSRKLGDISPLGFRCSPQRMFEQAWSAMIAAAPASPIPTSVNGAGEREALVQYVTHYGPQCRDCADEDGVCPATGIGCGQRAKAAAFVVDALIYGAKHSYVPAALSPALDNTAVEWQS